jgi:hypothetical protein
MRLGLYDAAEGDAASAAVLSSLVAALGATTVSVRSAAAPGRRFPWDVVLLSAPFGAGEDARATAAAIEAFARAGGPVLGIAGGFQGLCALGLLPGRVVDRSEGASPPELWHVRVEGRPTPFTSAIPAGRVLRSGSVPAGLQYEIGTPEALRARGQVVFRYCDAAGAAPSRVTPGQIGQLFPPRALGSIAGVCGEAGNVVGLLAAPDILGGDGAQLLGSLRMHVARAGRSEAGALSRSPLG